MRRLLPPGAAEFLGARFMGSVVLLCQPQNLFRLGVARHDKNRVVRGIMSPVEFQDVVQAERFDFVPPADRGNPVGMVQVKRRSPLLGKLGIGIVVGSFVPLLQNDIAFGGDILGRDQQPVHPVGFQLHDGFEMFRRHPLIVPCVVGSGERVLDPSDRLDNPVDFARPVIFRAPEHHVLDEMRDPGFPRRFVGGADAVKDHVRDRRRPMVLDDDDLHSVFQPELDRRGRGGQLLRTRQQQSGHNGAT